MASRDRLRSARKLQAQVTDKAREVKALAAEKLRQTEVRTDAALRALPGTSFADKLADSEYTIPILVGLFAAVIALSLVIVTLLHRA